jgi:hypothetical protein
MSVVTGKAPREIADEAFFHHHGELALQLRYLGDLSGAGLGGLAGPPCAFARFLCAHGSVLGPLVGDAECCIGVDGHPDQRRRFGDENDRMKENPVETTGAVKDEVAEQQPQRQMVHCDESCADENGADIIEQGAHGEGREEGHVHIDLHGVAAHGDQHGGDFPHQDGDHEVPPGRTQPHQDQPDGRQRSEAESECRT